MILSASNPGHSPHQSTHGIGRRDSIDLGRFHISLTSKATYLVLRASRVIIPAMHDLSIHVTFADTMHKELMLFR